MHPHPDGALRGDIGNFLHLRGNNIKKREQNILHKPEALITELIKAYCPKNKKGQYEGTILDPFHGSGTLGVCCEKLNKQGHKIRWIGFELEEKWVNVCKQRIEEI